MKGVFSYVKFKMVQPGAPRHHGDRHRDSFCLLGISDRSDDRTEDFIGHRYFTLGFGIWGAVDFHQAGRMAEPLRLIEELVISGLAALALYATGQHVLGLAFVTLSIIYHLLVYLAGGRLLKTQPQI